MTDTATPETGPVDAPASIESITAEFEAGGDEAPASDVESITQELVNEAEGEGEAQGAPGTEDDATDPADPTAEFEAENPEEGTPAEQMVTVKVAGEDREVPLSEALAGYSRLEDYKAKTAEVAERGRQLEQQRATLETDLKAQFANQLEEATNLFAQYDPVLAEAQKIDWATLKRTDPAAFVQAQDAVNVRLNAIQQMQQQVAQARQESGQRQQELATQERAQRFDAAAEKIVEAMPELADEAKFADFAKTNIGFLREVGFTQDEIADSLDHRVLSLADEARQWRAHKAAQAKLPEKKVVQKSAVKPLTTDGEGSRTQKPRFPANASRERRVDYVANQILSEF